MKKLLLFVFIIFTKIISAQVANQPGNIELCDENNDGVECVDLSFQIPQILGGQNPSDYTVTFHATQFDADIDSNPLPTTYCSTNAETIYVRVEDNASGGVMFDTTSFDILLNFTPTISGPANLDLFLCDEPNNDDGFTIFDLTTNETQILGTQSPLDFSFNYFETSSDANNDVNQISNPSSYANIIAYNQTIYIRLSSVSSDCFVVVSFDIIVGVNPVLIQPTPLSVCDDDVDEFAIFDLTSKETELLGGQAGITFQYYASQVDLTNDLPITNPTSYQNLQNPQVVYIRGTNTGNCTDVVTLTLRVLPIPAPNIAPTPIEACDDNTDGILVFDLTVRETEILNGEGNVTVSYHFSQTDAELGQNSIVDPTMHSVDMVNANSNGQVIIYVRVESQVQIDSNFEPCYATVELPVIINTLPILTSSSFSYVFCELDNDSVGQFNFDTITATLNLLQAPQNINDFTVSYHATVADAMNNAAPLANGYENTSDPNTVFIRVTNTNTGCFNGNNIASLDLIVESAPTATAPFSAYEECAANSSNQDSAIFDLTSFDGQIIGGGANVSVSYYETSADAMATTNPISSTFSYINASNPQTLYARTQNIINGCYSNVVTLTLQVNPLPVVTLPDDTARCVDATGMLINPFDIGTDLGPGHSYQWTTPQGMATTPIVTVTEAGTYSLFVTDNNSSTSCGYSDSITITGDFPPCSLSVEEVTTSNIVLYPNPVQNELILKLEANTQVERIEMYSVNGKLIHQQNVISGSDEVSIDVHNFTAGFYILKIQTKDKRTLTKRFIVE